MVAKKTEIETLFEERQHVREAQEAKNVYTTVSQLLKVAFLAQQMSRFIHKFVLIQIKFCTSAVVVQCGSLHTCLNL